MSEFTPHYNLEKQNPPEFYDVRVQSGNMDKIDAQMHQNAQGIERVEEALENKADLEDGKIPMDQLPELGSDLSTAPMKPSIADGDGVVITDSAESHATKRVLWSTIKGALGKLFVPMTRTINRKPLSADITLGAADVGAASASHNHDAGNIVSGVFPVGRGGTGKASWAANQLLYASGAGTLAQLGFPPGANHLLQQSPNGVPSWVDPSTMMTNIGGVRIIFGSYEGACDYTQKSRPMTLNFSAPIKLLHIYGKLRSDVSPMEVSYYGQSIPFIISPSINMEDGNSKIRFTWDANFGSTGSGSRWNLIGIKWSNGNRTLTLRPGYPGDPKYNFNEKGTTYYYWALI